ncbi:MAG: aminotransferase class V-fold PLP-dependent enzyme [Bacteroidetes bacterium]|nr:aminotransferase class V-fold PLP-dependent enzyme [Bacteroidota bacterium]
MLLLDKNTNHLQLQRYFHKYREQIVGRDQLYRTPYGVQKMLYADWVASGRLYMPIERILVNSIGPFIGNTHTETSETGRLMTQAYQLAHQKIKRHVNAGKQDVILTTGFGMTGALVKFQRILGMKICGGISHRKCLKEEERPVVFVTHMEHHSNQTTWYETSADVVVIEPGEDMLVDLNRLEDALKKYRHRKRKIGSFTACSNVTGIRTPYLRMARLMHEYGGLAFIDFAASAPYDPIDMHPSDPLEKLDAIFFSPHKFLGGPGASGVLVFDSALYNSKTPDLPGGGTVDWTNPWGEYKYIDNIEMREDGGTPGFLQAIKTALALELKSQMGTVQMQSRERQLVRTAFRELSSVPGIQILADHVTDRLGIISFYIPPIHYNLIVKLLSDRFGIQVRGGCVCAGTYGHFLLNVSPSRSKIITDRINAGDLSEKPGWVRLSIHPTMTEEELQTIADSLKQIAIHHREWGKDYSYDKHTNEFKHFSTVNRNSRIEEWFTIR